MSHHNTNTNGFGKLFVSNDKLSFSYNGYIKNGQFDKFGLIIYTLNKINPTIVRYEGEFLLNEYHGKGKLTYKNGDIFETIQSLLSNKSYLPSKCEIIVIDNRITIPNQDELVSFCKERPTQIQYFWEKSIGLTAARHLGLKKAKSNIIALYIKSLSCRH